MWLTCLLTCLLTMAASGPPADTDALDEYEEVPAFFLSAIVAQCMMMGEGVG